MKQAGAYPINPVTPGASGCPRILNAEGAPATPAPSWRIHLDGARKEALETGRTRLLVAGIVFCLAFLVVAGRLVDLALLGPAAEPRLAAAGTPATQNFRRADIVDRNGVLLATSLPTASLYADAREIIDPRQAAARLVAELPDLSHDRVLAKLTSTAGFIWLRRNLTPRQTYAVNRLGIPGLHFLQAEKRVYPQGREASHVLGLTDVDGRGTAGVECFFDGPLRRGGGALELSIDIRIQAMLRRELAAAVTKFDALGAAGLVLDVRSGETLGMVSLPDFDPNVPAGARGEAAFNRVSKGVYEMGSTFKLINTAMALDSGTVTLRDGYDATKPIRVARFTINDFHARNRWLSVPEILVYSSNIGAAKMALDVGGETQRTYLDRFGLLKPAATELPEVGVPLSPTHWRDINTMTIAYGHGIAVSPVQLAGAVGAIVNGGIRMPVTILKHHQGAPFIGERVVSAETSSAMRRLMRLVVQKGTGRKADVPGYRVGGKTGTAEKLIAKRYQANALISSFVGAFPTDAPRYVVLVLIDEPKGKKSTFGYATGGWVAAPVVGRLVRQIAPLVGMAPAGEEKEPAPGNPLFIPVKGGP
jgi:cell division protein FtsI (penicillin-binding protein 3)